MVLVLVCVAGSVNEYNISTVCSALTDLFKCQWHEGMDMPSCMFIPSYQQLGHFYTKVPAV